MLGREGAVESPCIIKLSSSSVPNQNCLHIWILLSRYRKTTLKAVSLDDKHFRDKLFSYLLLGCCQSQGRAPDNSNREWHVKSVSRWDQDRNIHRKSEIWDSEGCFQVNTQFTILSLPEVKVSQPTSQWLCHICKIIFAQSGSYLQNQEYGGITNTTLDCYPLPTRPRILLPCLHPHIKVVTLVQL